MSPETKVDFIINDFRKRILRGEFGTAGRLPSLRMLAEQFETTHETMNKVIQRLQAEGLLFSEGRAGVFVNSIQKHIPGLTPNLADFFQEQGLILEEADIDMPSWVAAQQEVAEALKVEEDSTVVRRYRSQGTHHGVSTVLFRTVESFYPSSLVDKEMLQQMQQDVHFDVLKSIKDTHAKEIGRVHERLTGRFPTAEEQEQLRIVRNTPVFDVRRTSYSANDEIEDGSDLVIMYSRLIFVASHFVLTYDYIPYWRRK
jgi:DNA-binding GntR family transcriptional regulator